MLSQRRTDDLGHRHSAKAGFALGGTECGHSPEGRGELAVHPHMPAHEVDAIDSEPEAFALTQSHCGGEDDQGTVRLRDRRTSASTSLTPSGTTSVSARFGSEMRTQGDAAISRSPTAALKMVETQR
jgi:hypothetical protein